MIFFSDVTGITFHGGKSCRHQLCQPVYVIFVKLVKHNSLKVKVTFLHKKYSPLGKINQLHIPQ